MLSQEAVESHLEMLQGQELQFTEQLLVVRGAIRNCEVILEKVTLDGATIVPKEPEVK